MSNPPYKLLRRARLAQSMRLLESSAETVNYHVWLDGVDVSKDATKAYVSTEEGKEVPGRVLLLDRNAQGKAFCIPGTDTVSMHWHSGLVKWVKKL